MREKSNHSKGNNETTQIDLTYIILYTVIHVILPAIFSYKMLQIAYYALDESILNDGIYRKRAFLYTIAMIIILWLLNTVYLIQIVLEQFF